MPKLVGQSKRDRQSISFRKGQIAALSQIAELEGHGNLSLVIQNIADAEIQRRLHVASEELAERDADELQVA